MAVAADKQVEPYMVASAPSDWMLTGVLKCLQKHNIKSVHPPFLDGSLQLPFDFL